MYLIEVFGKYFYAVEHAIESRKATALFAVEDGVIRPAISSVEASRIAKGSISNAGEPREVLYVTVENISKHHEYREKPLPAWAVTFENNVSVYLSADTGQIGAVRTDNWRVFDFLWMLHTMDFEGRDNINNYVLRGFSILGIVTVLSGFLLFAVSSKPLRRLLSRRV